jgi:hypothetical protein
MENDTEKNKKDDIENKRDKTEQNFLEYSKNSYFGYYFSEYGSKGRDKIFKEKNKSSKEHKEAHKSYENSCIREVKKSSTYTFEFKRIY